MQTLGHWSLSKHNLRIKVSARFRKAVNVLFTVFWLLHTFHSLADDFARDGLALREPFPISVLQVLGLGSASRARQLGLDYGPPRIFSTQMVAGGPGSVRKQSRGSTNILNGPHKAAAQFQWETPY